MIRVADIFATHQGEGPFAGRAATFLRLGLCNLHCSWCDTPYTWNQDAFDIDAECPWRSEEWVIEQVGHPDLVVLTGGEPLIWMQRGNDRGMRQIIGGTGGDWHVETNGTLTPTPFFAHRIDHWIVSPKVNYQGDPLSRRITTALNFFAEQAEWGRATFKVVVEDEADVHAAAVFFNDYLIPPKARWVMPQARTTEELAEVARAVTPAAIKAGLHLSLRHQVELYGDERGH